MTTTASYPVTVADSVREYRDGKIRGYDPARYAALYLRELDADPTAVAGVTITGPAYPNDGASFIVGYADGRRQWVSHPGGMRHSGWFKCTVDWPHCTRLAVRFTGPGWRSGYRDAECDEHRADR